jgi:uncharacterized repeat protein (TIGR02543 family)
MKTKIRLMKIIIALLSTLLIASTGYTVLTQVINPGVVTVSFVTNGGTSLPDLKVTENSTILHLEEPLRIGYKFDGWFRDPNLNTPFNRFSNVNEAMTLYAKWSAIEYIILFDSRGGSLVAPQRREYNANLTAPPSPTRSGHIFEGWYEDPSFNRRYEFTTMPAQNITLYANWTTGQSSISFETNGGTAINPLNDYVGSMITNVPITTREGYTFAGWYSNSQLTTPFNFDVMPTSSITVYAKWDINQYRVSYFNSEEQEMDDSMVDYGTLFTPPNPPEIEHYDFMGWYLDEDLTEPYLNTEPITKQLALYAKWELTEYEISYESMGGSAVASGFATVNETVAAPNVPTKPGFQFSGWYTNTEFNELYQFDTPITQSMTLYARWEEKQIRLTFDSLGGTPVDFLEAFVNDEIDEPVPPTLTGYSFKGWYEDVNYTTPFTFDLMPSNDLTLYAKWEINTYTITFETFGGTQIEPMMVEYNSIVPFPQFPEREGFIPSNIWYEDVDFVNSFQFFTKMPARNLVLYFKWIPFNNNTLYFITNGGTPAEHQVYKTGDPVQLPETIRLGYNFDGWYYENTFVTKFDHEFMPFISTTLHAKWVPAPFVITFDTLGGSDIQAMTFDFNSQTEAPADPTKYGYRFEGWFISEDAIEPYDFNQTMPANDFVLYARWLQSPYSISFNTMGGSLLDPVYANHSDPIFEPVTPEFEGFTFAGWYLDDTYDNTFIFDTMPAEDVILYAKWEINTYTIQFNTFGGTNLSPITASFETPIQSPVEPYRYGHKFIGWYLEDTFDTMYVFEFMPAENITLYAKWEIQSYFILFLGGPEATLSQNAIIEFYNQPIEEPQIPSRTGHTFNGWFKDEALTTPFNFDFMPGENTILYAKWTVNVYTLLFVYGVNGNTLEVELEYGETIDFPVVTKNLFTFGGWYTDSTAVDNPFNATTMPAQDTILYARWIGNIFTITFDSQGGSFVDSLSVRFHDIITPPIEPTKEGHIFAGWYLNPQFTGTPYFQNEVRMPPENFTLYAKWTPIN